MAKLPPERLAAALRANLKRRKQQPSAGAPPETGKDPEKPKEKPSSAVPQPQREMPSR